jgi:hypothetical protein
MSPEEVRWRLLVTAAEDYANPIEALWEFGLPDDPVDGAPDPDTIRATLRDLVAEGLVRLYWNQEVYGDPRPVPEEEQLAVLDDPSNWRLFQEGERGVRFTTTPAGDEAVGRRPPGVPPYPA